ncbi:5-formaminoimidazole-4-carboxamide-1-(beta)-D-ribofuranosyl 5'-monophosphate synthetase [Candidatus Bilamarchaeum dharawalense]|uniref:5-formaminoimidazole-4-carboxamide-1-(Beta)-D-rib ofuranosyl 5'-monophosphate synthetase n=1 Tax=Candidatus Bilamarchaeum dharawalense TaxID=2885759 RepID=A0A5E4LQY4_9ARCH|nr:5-formaminoimidazole-4-carboxamide-1-(beta)-D-ribofuranosyl 5'-monophosphate synthetase [Candidatus Bilamarchaeum dharawalense]
MEYTISTLGSHSALDVSEGAKKEGFRSLVVAQRGREKVYLGPYKTRKRGKKEIGVIDELLLLGKFNEILTPGNREFMKKRNCIFVPNRSFAVYVGYEGIEKEFDIPVFGNKYLLRAEERDVPKNQYYLMEKAGVRTPKQFKSPKDINKLSIVKVSEAKRTYERAFFLARNFEEYTERSEALIKSGKTTREQLQKAKIEEYIVGAQFNLNFFYSPVHEELELLGVDTRRQTNLDGYLRMPADVQLDLLKMQQPSTIEVGHIACTLRESLLEQVYEVGENFVRAVQKEYKNGIIGPFALQGAFVEEEGEKFVCFDVSLRMPGSPGTRFTPYSEYMFRESISFGRRIAMEIKDAQKAKMMDKITT